MVRKRVSEERDEGVVFGREKLEEEAFEELVVGLGGVLKSAGAVTAEEAGGGHESAVEDVAFFDLGVVEEDREGNTVEESDDSRV